MMLLDLFCGGGGCSAGFHAAGFQVTGVDLYQQPHYPFSFRQADALEFLEENGHKFDVVHASPTCQRFSRRGSRREQHPDLIEPLRRLLEKLGKPYIIENVPGAPLIEPCKLRGTMFRLAVIRERWFETNWPLVAPPDLNPDARIGDGYFSVTGNTGGKACKKSGGRRVDGGTADEWRQAMGISWLPVSRLTQSVPPAYTEYIGKKLLMWMRV